MLKSLALIGLGGALGSILRWFLALGLNQVCPAIPLGTLAANVGGGYLTGILLGFCGNVPGLDANLRLLLMTGFLGGLTTFFTFTAEVGLMLQQERLMAATAIIALHVCGSLAALFLGMGTYSLARHF